VTVIAINPLVIAIFDCGLLAFQDLEEKLVMIHENTGNLISRVVALRAL
tara:strand:- start:850 stop:996 length:147 start_codon:yes stop_codon:yes gene_type:complete